MFVVDTNILVYAADADAPEHARCRLLLEQWRQEASPWYLTWGIIYEFLRVSTHPRVLKKPFNLGASWSFVQAILAAPSVSILAETDRHNETAKEVFEETPGVRGNLVFDAHTAILMREHGIRVIYTRDTDFNRFDFIDVVDPLSGSRRTSRRR